MKDVVIRITPQEQMRIKAIALDQDKEDAFEFLKLLLEKIEAASIPGMRSHLDQHS